MYFNMLMVQTSTFHAMTPFLQVVCTWVQFASCTVNCHWAFTFRSAQHVGLVKLGKVVELNFSSGLSRQRSFTCCAAVV